jgi:hypothetical protein
MIYTVPDPAVAAGAPVPPKELNARYRVALEKANGRIRAWSNWYEARRTEFAAGVVE